MNIAIDKLYIIDEFHADVKTGHLIQMTTGLCLMCSNGLGVVWMRKLFSEETLLFIGLNFFTMTFMLFFFFYRLWMIVIIMPFACFGISLVTTSADSLLTSLVTVSEQGTVLSIAATFHSFVRTFAPAVSGLLLEKHGFMIFPFLGTLATAFGHATILLFPIRTHLFKKQS
ncbi:hypothetical protein RB195_002820 [Necator americanus]|uniref:Major facilitator superfamily (MFS) profile domain-containing protein n=1 Tax=Necator americanus TaxID=51031 RepID=A0ABR1DL16_NECAM